MPLSVMAASGGEYLRRNGVTTIDLSWYSLPLVVSMEHDNVKKCAISVSGGFRAGDVREPLAHGGISAGGLPVGAQVV